MNELSQRHRVPVKQAVIHLQVTADEKGNPVWYAEALIQGEQPVQRCALRGPIRLNQESETLQLFLAELGKVMMERTTFV